MSAPAEIKFGILGPVEIHDDVRHLRIRPSSPMQRNLLLALLVKAGAIVTSDTLFYELWGDYAPEKAANALQAHVTRLRRLLRNSETNPTGPGRIIATANGYALHVAPAEIDAWHFGNMTAQARRITRENPERAVELYRAALALWRGTAVADEPPRGVLSTNRLRQLEEERLIALEALYDAALRAGMHDQIVGELEVASSESPFRERFYDQLMVALYRCGRQSEALGVYERARRILVKELGLEPVPALTQRMQEILSHAPSLLNSPPGETISVHSGGHLPVVAPVAADQVVPTVPLPRSQSDAGRPDASDEQSELARLRLMINDLTGVVRQLVGGCTSCVLRENHAHNGPSVSRQDGVSPGR